MPLSFLIFFLILCVLILLHEAGHFFAAKLSRVRVHEFGLGLPPKIFGKKFGDTEYTLNWLPIGGFVRIEGEDPTDTADKAHNFQFKKPATRLFILLAGVFMNVVTATMLFYFYFVSNSFLSSPIVDFGTSTSFIGGKEIKIDTVVSGFASETNSKNLSSGDVIYNAISPSGEILVKDSTLKIASTKNDFIRNADNLSLKEFQDFIKNQTGEYTVFTYNLQYDQAAEKKVNVFFDKKSSRNVIGVYLSRVIFIDYGVTPLTKLFSGLAHSFNVLSYSTKTLYTLISYSFVTRDISAVSEGVSGPIGIYSVIDSLVASKASNTFFAIIDIAGIISLSLAFMNVLPIPALDGGRAVFVVFELIFKKKVKPSIESNIHKAGMSFLLLLLFLITIKDVVKLF